MQDFIDICEQCSSQQLINYVFENKIEIKEDDKLNDYCIFYLAISNFINKNYDKSFNYFKKCNLMIAGRTFCYIISCYRNDSVFVSWQRFHITNIKNYILIIEKNITNNNQLGKIYNQLGLFFEFIANDENKCFEYYLKSAETGDIGGIVNTALCYKYGTGCIVDFNKYVQILENNIHRNDPYILNKLANYYYQFVPEKKKLAIRYIMRAYSSTNDIGESKRSREIIGNDFLFNMFLEWYKLTYEKECNDLKNKLNEYLNIGKHLINIIVEFTIE